jgi:AraC-like DNA-binding protein
MASVANIVDPSNSASPVFFQHYIPGRPLSEFVGVFWYWRGHDVRYSKERILPMGTAELVIDLGSGQTNGAGISGPQSQSVIIERTAYDELLGIHFNAGGAFPFLGFPVGDLHGLNITLSDLWGERRASQLLWLLHEARTVEMKFQVLEQWLKRIADRPLRHHPAVSFALKEFQQDPGLLSSAAVAEKVNLSQRRFIQLFRDEVGMTPKLFCRIQRFHAVIGMTSKLDTVDWVDVALSHGYFDQSHFIHDFQEFSGLSPTQYLGLRTEHLNHVRVRD